MVLCRKKILCTSETSRIHCTYKINISRRLQGFSSQRNWVGKRPRRILAFWQCIFIDLELCRNSDEKCKFFQHLFYFRILLISGALFVASGPPYEIEPSKYPRFFMSDFLRSTFAWPTFSDCHSSFVIKVRLSVLWCINGFRRPWFGCLI